MLAWLGGPRLEGGEARFTARAPAGGRLPWRDEPRRGRGSPGPRNVLLAAAARVAPGRTLREGAGRGRLGGALGTPSPPGRRQNAPWIPAAGAGFAAPPLWDDPAAAAPGLARHGPGESEGEEPRGWRQSLPGCPPKAAVGAPGW